MPRVTTSSQPADTPAAASTAAHQQHEFTIALAGNPNSGKTSVFNAITGAHQHVANWPGVTVEKKEGKVRHDGVTLHVVDLPGTYSLTTYSMEEIVARNFLVHDKPDVVVDIVDSSNIDRNLYLSVQLLELGVPLVLALNMSDMAEAAGIDIDDRLLSQLLGVPVVRTVGTKGKGIDELLRAAIAVARDPRAALAQQRRADYGNEVEPHVEQLTEALLLKFLLEPNETMVRAMGHRRWIAAKLLEGDSEVVKLLSEMFTNTPAAGNKPDSAAHSPATTPDGLKELLEQADKLRKHIESTLGRPGEIVLADRRYGFIHGACAEAVRRPASAGRSVSDRIDAVMTHRWLGLPIFALMMYMVFQVTFWIGNPMVDFLDAQKEQLAQFVRSALAGENLALLRSLLADGIVEGVGAVLSFVPLVLLLFLAIAILEDSGYMARAAFVLDRLMHRIGLHGKSFIPMLVGFGCTVPAVMATRILETRRDRLTTMLVLPLMSCGARLPVYVLLLGAFFPAQAVLSIGPVHVTNQALLLLLIYALGIVLAIAVTKILRVTIFRGEITPFVMELPPYRRPALRGLAIHMWERGWLYVRKAGTIILAIVVVLWAAKTWPGLPDSQIASFDKERTVLQAQASRGALDNAQLEEALGQVDVRQAQEGLTHSTVGRIGQTIAPVFEPAGFDWRISTAMLGAFAAKEVFVGQMGVIYAVGDDASEESTTLRQKLANDYTQLQGFSLMLFVLIATPCMATVAVTARESGHWKWALLQYTYLTALGWLLATAVYQSGHALGWG